MYTVAVRFFLILTVVFACQASFGQSIVDPCFLSVGRGQYIGSSDLYNYCGCGDPSVASDIVEWDPVRKFWAGRHPLNRTLDLAPPIGGCLVRAIWMGNERWTSGGEGFALRLDKGLESGKTYSYTFTYAADGVNGEDGGFRPVIYSNNSHDLDSPVILDTLPGADNAWITNTISFQATPEQEGHNWLVFHTLDVSGIFLALCEKENPLTDDFLRSDTSLCYYDTIRIHAPVGEDYEYLWNTGDTTSSRLVNTPGMYSVKMNYFYCSESDTVNIDAGECKELLVMPNVFSPNGDLFNPVFKPKEANYIHSGTMTILNRWGEEIFTGDLLTGWNGRHNSTKDAATGVYYYYIFYEDTKMVSYWAKGTVTLMR